MLLGAAAVYLTAAPGGDPFAVVAWVVAIVVGAGALFTALGAIFKGLRSFGRWLRKSFFPTIVTGYRLITVMADLPDTLARMNAKWDAHMVLADQKVALLDTLDARTAATAERVELILGEVKNNGGSSAKDSLHRIEVAVGLPQPAKTPAPECTGPIPTVKE